MTAPLFGFSDVPGLTVDRRRGSERRRGERRRAPEAQWTERRTGSDRRHGTERRESAGGHVRNAIQLLEFLLAQRSLPDRERDELAAVARRLWLALWEIERTGRSVGGRDIP